MNATDISWLSASIELGELIAGIPSGILADKFGRRTLCLLIAPLCTLNWLLLIFTRNLIVLYITRILQGVALGISFTNVPTYIAEISSPNVRGAFGGHTVVIMYVGFLYSYCTSYNTSYRHYLYFQSILPVLFFVTFIFMPESPYYYYMKKKNDKADKALKWLRGNGDFTEEALEIQKAVDEDMKRKGSKWRDLVATESDRRILFIVQMVNVAAYMTGVQSLSMFATETFANVPLIWISAKDVTIAMGLILCISAFLASFVADTVGRRKLLIVSSAGITVSNLVISVYYFLSEKTSVDVSDLSWIMYLGLGGLCVFTNIGVGELVHTIQAEFFPSHTRSLGGGLTSFVAAIAIFISVKTYQPVAQIFGFYMNFLIYAVISLITLVLIIIYVTEAAGKMMATCASFTWLEPLTLWLISDKSEIKMTSTDISWLSASIELGEVLAGIPSGILADK
ncbi:hypothetical protein O3M35_012967 [Rhynocoris fuscipes]|uniref:Major facilitator superfamily (MFS) profile domain-containing protein n=1 Tax=Rhynocoris fuscipes TaxID=488301 RepID=A0AAW1CHI2_9HEMI